jgi:hypothetical protein
MPTDENQTLIPEEIANRAINRNINIATRLPWLLVLVQAGRFDDTTTLINNLVSGLADADADLRTLRDAVANALIRNVDAEIPYAYTTDHKCVVCDNPLRYPLVWNRTLKDTGEYICAVGECSGSGGATQHADGWITFDDEPDCDTAG